MFGVGVVRCLVPLLVSGADDNYLQQCWLCHRICVTRVWEALTRKKTNKRTPTHTSLMGPWLPVVVFFSSISIELAGVGKEGHIKIGL